MTMVVENYSEGKEGNASSNISSHLDPVDVDDGANVRG